MIRIILNPVSGTPRLRSAARHLIEQQQAALGGERVEVFVTRYPGHARELALEARNANCERVVAVGGDGTLNEIIGALAGGKTPLALIPCGSGNGLARHLRIPLRLEEAVDLALSEQPQLEPIDLGVADGRHFANVVGFGFDAEVARRFALSRRRGLLVYIWHCLRLWPNYRAFDLKIRTAEGASLKVNCLLAAFANSSQYGNGAQIAPWARTNDGLLEMVALTPASPLCLARDVLRLFSGKIQDSPRIQVCRSSSFEVSRPAGIAVHVDGEPVDSPNENVKVAADSSCLNVVIPQKTPPQI